MLLLLRKTLFYILLVLYLILTPYLLLFGLGYVFNPSEGELMKTGLVSVMTEPKGATLYLEGKKFSKRTPAVIRGLRPGQYEIRINKKGFDAWKKNIQILPEKAARLEPVILLPQHPETEVLAPGPFEDLARVTEFKVFALKNEEFSGLTKIDLLFKNESKIEPNSSSSSSPTIKILESHFKKGSSTVLFRVEQDGKKKWILYDFDKEKILKNITSWIPETWEAVDWDGKVPSHFIVFSKGTLSILDLSKEIVIPIAQNLLGFGMRGSKVYFLKQDFSVWQSDFKGEGISLFMGVEQNLADAFLKTKSSFCRLEFLKRDFLQKDTLLFLSDTGALLGSLAPYLLVEHGVQGILPVEHDPQKLAYWTKEEIGVFDFSFNEEEEIFPPRTILYRSGSQIHQLFWAYENSHLIFQDKNEVFLLEAGEQSPYQVRYFGAVAENSKMIYSDRHHSLYFLAPENRALIRRKISE